MMHMPSRMGVGVLDSGYIRPLTRQRIMCTGDTPVNELAMLVYVNLTSVHAATAAVNADRPADPDPRRKSQGRRYGVRCECPEWLLDLKEVTLGVQQQQSETSLLLDGPPAAYTAAKALPPSSVTVTLLKRLRHERRGRRRDCHACAAWIPHPSPRRYRSCGDPDHRVPRRDGSAGQVARARHPRGRGVAVDGRVARTTGPAVPAMPTPSAPTQEYASSDCIS